MNILTVDPAEQGMKLLRFLARRLAIADETLLHRWIRTGQVRVNSARAKPFALLSAGDAVRVPPFAAKAEAVKIPPPKLAPGLDLGGNLRLLAVTDTVLALDKPGGMPTQPGSGHADSVVQRLRTLFAGQAYIPAPAHRLDKDCTGIVLAGRTHVAQKRLHELFAEKTSQAGDAKRSLEKTYLAWVRGIWPYDGVLELRDELAKGPAVGGKGERVRAVAQGQGAPAFAEASLCGKRLHGEAGEASLLRIRLHTGRTHQIRVQLAERGFPIIGDVKYGGGAFAYLLLHAHHVAFSSEGTDLAAFEAASWPKHWPEPFAVSEQLYNSR